MPNTSFVNPYNFMPLHDEPPARGRIKRGNLSGVIRISLLTRTPLFIPNTSNSDAFGMKAKHEDHKSYDFFSYEDLSEFEGTRDGVYSEPVIPGSEIRGMLRSYYEILTNSCLSFVDDDEVLSKRTNEVFNSGLIERKDDGSFVLHEAEDCVLRMRNNDALEVCEASQEPNFNVKSYRNKQLREGQKVYVRIAEQGEKKKPIVESLKTSDDGESEIGYVIKGEKGPKKHNCHIFIRNGIIRELKTEEVSTLTAALGIYRANAKALYNEYREEWLTFKQGKGETLFPVYYSRIGNDGKIMLSPASITREIYTTKLRALLKDHRTCTDQDSLCPACALFGMLGETVNATSRVRVTDMRLSKEYVERFNRESDSLFADIVTLAPLSSPKINNMEFYVKRPADNAMFWTYDYYVDDKGNVHEFDPEINGRKFYWHQPEMKLENHKPGTLNITIRPLESGVAFVGKIFFDHLMEEELSKLVYSIDAGDKADLKEKQHCYKLGHAKPLGYGSVAMRVDSVEVRDFSIDDSNGSIEYNLNEKQIDNPRFEGTILNHFEKMTSFGLLKGRDVHYPKPESPAKDGSYPIYKWFVDNHGSTTGGMPNSRQKMTYREYMCALNPDLKKTEAPGAGRKERTTNSEKRPQGNPHTNGSNKLQNTVISVRVIHIWDDGTIIFKTDNGRKGRVYGDRIKGRSFNIGDEVKVSLYSRKPDREFDIYNLAKGEE